MQTFCAAPMGRNFVASSSSGNSNDDIMMDNIAYDAYDNIPDRQPCYASAMCVEGASRKMYGRGFGQSRPHFMTK